MYRVVTDRNLLAFQKDVEKLMADGFKFQGGVRIVPNNSINVIYSQTMIKEEY